MHIFSDNRNFSRNSFKHFVPSLRATLTRGHKITHPYFIQSWISYKLVVSMSAVASRETRSFSLGCTLWIRFKDVRITRRQKRLWNLGFFWNVIWRHQIWRLSAFLADLLGNKSLLQRVQKVTRLVIGRVEFDPFCVFSGCLPLGWSGSGLVFWDYSDNGRWTNESTSDKDSSVHFIYHDPSDLRSLILILIISKERTLCVSRFAAFELRSSRVFTF